MAQGDSAATLGDIARRAGIEATTVEELFGDSKHILLAVFEEAEREANGAALSAARSVPQEGIEPLLAGCRCIIELYHRPGPGQTVLAEARKVLSMAEWFRVDRRFGAGALRGGLRDAAERGAIRADAVEALTTTIYGAVTEASLVAAENPDAYDVDGFMRTLETILLAHTP